jgi:hypothetical protein
MRRSIPMMIVTAALVLCPIGIAKVNGQELLFTHGAVEGGQVRTSGGGGVFGESVGFSTVSNSTMTVVLASGDSDLFVLEFSAQCAVLDAENIDFMLVKATFSRQGVITTFTDLDPKSSLPVFCTGDSGSQSNHKMWAVRLTNNGDSPATYQFFVRVRLLDQGTDDFVRGFLGNRTVRLTRYN